MHTEKFDFTSAGVAEWNTYFYALSPSDQATQAQAVQSDLRQWLPTSFQLEADQVDWLAALDDTSIFVLGNQLSAAMALGLPIRLVKPEKPNGNVGLLGVKRGDAHNPAKTRFHAGQPPEGEGEFVFTITY